MPVTTSSMAQLEKYFGNSIMHAEPKLLLVYLCHHLILS